METKKIDFQKIKNFAIYLFEKCKFPILEIIAILLFFVQIYFSNIEIKNLKAENAVQIAAPVFLKIR